MNKQQFLALIDYIDSRIELQDSREELKPAFFYKKNAELKIKALKDAEYVVETPNKG